MAAAANGDGRLELFGSRGTDKAIGHAWQTWPNGQWALTQQTSGCPPV
jgi:hypothetical protein